MNKRAVPDVRTQWIAIQVIERRVPFIVRWPGRIKPRKSDALVSQIDLIASFADLLGQKLGKHQSFDSRNIMPALLGETNEGLPWMLEESGRSLALRRGPWKYIETQLSPLAELKEQPEIMARLAKMRG